MCDSQAIQEACHQQHHSRLTKASVPTFQQEGIAERRTDYPCSNRARVRTVFGTLFYRLARELIGRKNVPDTRTGLSILESLWAVEAGERLSHWGIFQSRS